VSHRHIIKLPINYSAPYNFFFSATGGETQLRDAPRADDLGPRDLVDTDRSPKLVPRVKTYATVSLSHLTSRDLLQFFGSYEQKEV
jgi:hypothetical protein